MDRESIDDVKRALRSLEVSLETRERELSERLESTRSLNAEVAQSRKQLNATLQAKSAAQRELKESARRKQVLEDEKRSFNGAEVHHQRRADYISQLDDVDARRADVEKQIKELSSQINDMKEPSSEAQKRLTVVRLMSMLDDLQVSLSAKVSAPADDGDEARAQELLKAIQELSRERERALMLLARKEVELEKTIDMKRRRIAELRMESDRNRSMLNNVNDAEVYGVVERIQRERRLLIQDIERLEETNEQLERIVLDTRYSSSGAQTNRKASLEADAALGTSRDPEEEKNQLRARIVAANAEKRRYDVEALAMKKRAEEEEAHYHEKMTRMLQEILMYEQENERLKGANTSLKAACDSIASTLEC